MNAYMQQRAVGGPWTARERLLVFMSPNAFSQRLIRTATRLAQELAAEWCAAYIETPADARFRNRDSDQITRNLHLAEELGAKLVTLSGDNVADSLFQYAQTHNIPKIVVGKPVKPRWVEFFKDLVVSQVGNIDVYTIRQ